LQGTAEDLAAIRKKLPGFTARLAELAEGIGAALADGIEQGEEPSETIHAQVSMLNSLAAALEAQKTEDIDRLLEELNQQNLDPKTREMVEAVSNDALMAEFETALHRVKNILEVYE
jgi:hypothetical protein